jgi:hypothetical protein
MSISPRKEEGSYSLIRMGPKLCQPNIRRLGNEELKLLHLCSSGWGGVVGGDVFDFMGF